MESIISKRIPYSRIRVISDAAQKLEAAGTSVIHMEIGRPDFHTPPNIVEAAVDALRSGKTHYCQNAGIMELRNAISDKYNKIASEGYDPGTEVIVTNGVSEGIYLAISSLLDPGEQVLIPDPAWINYQVVPLMGLAEPVTYAMEERHGFLPDVSAVEESITHRTRMLLLVNPSNPTGRVMPREVLQSFARMAVAHNLILISDEIYGDIVYAPSEFISMASFPEIRDRLIVLSGFSKSYSMTGWRLGYCVGPGDLISPMLRRHQYTLTSVSTFSQWGAVEALCGTREYVDGMVAEFKRRKEFLYGRIQEIPQLTCIRPEGAFYLFVSVKALGIDGYHASDILLNQYGIATVPGESFGKEGSGYIRLSYACSMEDLTAADEKLRQFAEAYAKR